MCLMVHGSRPKESRDGRSQRGYKVCSVGSIVQLGTISIFAEKEK